MEDETGGEDQAVLDCTAINLDPSPSSTIPQSTTTPILPPMEFHKVGYGICNSKDEYGYLGIKLEPSTTRINQ